MLYCAYKDTIREHITKHTQNVFFFFGASDIADTRYGILVILAISGLSVY